MLETSFSGTIQLPLITRECFLAKISESASAYAVGICSSFELSLTEDQKKEQILRDEANVKYFDSNIIRVNTKNQSDDAESLNDSLASLFMFCLNSLYDLDLVWIHNYFCWNKLK